MLRFLLLTTCALCICAMPTAFTKEMDLIIHNRPLATVNSKMITLIDVVKQLDTEICLHDPTLYSDNTLRYQYFQSNWQRVLQDLIEQELILADYEHKKLFEVSEGDVREEMQSRFGPNMMGKLDQIHLTHEEAKKMIENEMIVRQMLWYKAYSKAMHHITPEAIKMAYQAFLEQFPPKETWKYQTLSIKGSDKESCAKLAEKAFQLCLEQQMTFTQAAEELKKTDPVFSVTVSNDLEVEHKNLSTQHQSILMQLKEGMISTPITQNTKNNESVVRLFYLKEHKKDQPQSLEQMGEKLKNSLMQKAADIQKNDYINKLKSNYGFNENEEKNLISSDYQPFGLK
ncbi:MAG: hypothetical protein HY860_02860 [Chlamydiales bacterium]|nr:hypothetical protein [Chlamydiales bacterium]